MARIKNLVFSGKVDQFIFYKMNEKYYVRTAPDNVKQSKNTKIRSTNFGIAARAGKALRNGLLPVIPFPRDKHVQSKFSGAISKWLQLHSLQSLQPVDSIPYIADFQFNTIRTLQERFKIKFTINNLHNNSLEVTIPAFIPVITIVAPLDTISVKCSVAIAGCALESGTGTGSYTSSFNIPYDGNEFPEQKIVLPFTEANGNLIVVAASLSYTILKNGNREKCNNPSFMPSAIIKAMYC